jgi:hypothetical protein
MDTIHPPSGSYIRTFRPSHRLPAAGRGSEPGMPIGDPINEQIIE